MMTTRALTRICLLMTALSPPWSAAAAPSVGCGKALASGIYQMTDQSITRTYRVFVPSRYQPGAEYPLVIVFHGWGGDENESLGDEKVRTLSDERGYIVECAVIVTAMLAFALRCAPSVAEICRL
jgi:poly(3-hydroxybutyrate) depolymerase